MSVSKKPISFDINPVPHNTAKTQNKIREIATRGISGERNVAKSKLKRPETIPPKFPRLNLPERTMTSSELKKEKRLKNKYDDSEVKAKFIEEYGEELGKKYYFAWVRKQAMKEEVDYIYDLTEAKLSRAAKKLIKAQKARKAIAQGRFPKHHPVTGEDLEPRGHLHAFDVDETLFSHGKGKKPNVMVHVNDEQGNRVKSLTNQEYNTHKLEPGHSYDYSEFGKARTFTQTSSPNKRVIKKIKKLLKRKKNVRLITARAKFDNPEEFRQHLAKYGVRLPSNRISYTGGMRTRSGNDNDVGEKKVATAQALMKIANTDKVTMYDDAKKVHKAFRAARARSRYFRPKTVLATPNKEGEVMLRPFKEDFELWLDDLLNEGYDLSNYNIEELCSIYVDELLEDYELNESIFESPYTSILNDRSFNNEDEDIELSPYDYWKRFIDEEDDDLDEEYVDDYEEELEEDYEPTSYDVWKAYLYEKYLDEAQDGPEGEDPEADAAEARVSNQRRGQGNPNPARAAITRQRLIADRQRIQKMSTNADEIGDYLRQSAANM